MQLIERAKQYIVNLITGGDDLAKKKFNETPRRVRKNVVPADIEKMITSFLAGHPDIAETIFNRMELDGHIEGVKSARVAATSGLMLQFHTKEDSDAATAQIEFLDAVFDNIEVDSLAEEILEARFRMFKVIEPHWAMDQSRLVLTGFDSHDNNLFFIDRSDIYINKGGKKIPFADTEQDWFYAAKVRNKKAIYLRCVKPWVIKNFGVESWAHFVEVFADPLRIGYYPDGASKEIRNQVWEAVLGLGQDGAAAFPMSAKYELVETNRTGEQVHKGLVEKMEAEISKAIVGHSAGADATPGRLGGDTNAITVREDLIESDQRFVLRWIWRGFIKPLLVFNFSKPAPIYPIFTTAEVLTREEIRTAIREFWEMGGEVDPFQFEQFGVKVQETATLLSRRTEDLII